VSYGVHSQDIKKEIEVVSVLKNKTFYLRQSKVVRLVAKTPRTYFEIQLPPNTIQWFYSYTTFFPDETAKKSNLEFQLKKIVDSSNNNIIKAKSISSIKTPKGSTPISVYLMKNKTSAESIVESVSFIKGDFKYTEQGTSLEKAEGFLKIDEITSGKLYLSFVNLNKKKGINISVEVVAITHPSNADVLKSQKSALHYGSEAKAHLNKGNYSESIIYGEMSFKAYKLGWVQANIALAYLALDENEKALSIFKEATNLMVRQPNSAYLLDQIYNTLKTNTSNSEEFDTIENMKTLVELSRQ
jgi:tetratricopeptide (TPR) repeat protein